MKKFILSLLLTSGSFALNAQQTVFHDKYAEIRTVEEFTSIDISSSIDLQLSQGNENSVAVSASGEANRAGIKTVVKNGVLRIWYEQKNWFKGAGRKIRAYVSVKTLKKIGASGACDVTVNGELKTGELFIYLSGASDFKGTIITNSLKFDLSGASDVVVRGSAVNMSIGASGASRFKGFDMEAENCQINASGASDIKITVNKVLNAEATGATNIDYRGTGMIGEIRTSGASNIRREG